MSAKRPTGNGAKPRTPRPPVVEAVDRTLASEADVRKLLHELQVYSEEISVQNEQLIKAQSELEQARDRYADLYDFAPIGYLQVDSRATVVDVNLAGAELFGRMRSFILGTPLSAMFVNEHLVAVREFVNAARSQRDNSVLQTEARVRRVPDRVLRLAARPLASGTAHTLLVAMLDVTEERRLEAEKQAALESERQKAAELAAEVDVRLAAEQRIKTLLDRLVSVQEQERRRLALNLHDQLGQQLTALRLAVSSLRDNSSPAETNKRYALIEQIMSQLDRDVDFLAWELRPAALDEVGLPAALAQYVRHWSQASGVVAEVHINIAPDERFDHQIESNVYRIVQEAFNNVAKHARATCVSLLVEHSAGEMNVIVEDDGRGFDAANEGDRTRRGGMGLPGMRERAASIGGQIEIESTKGKGTTLFIRVPLSGTASPASRKKT